MILADAWSAVGGIAAVVAARAGEERGADPWSVVAAIATVVAAIAALVTIGFAWATVRQARDARKEASDAHTEEMAEQHRALQASTAAHQEQMRERQRALATEIKLQQVVQLERVAEVLTDLADTARAEAIQPPGRPLTDQAGQRLTGIPTVLARLGAAVALLDALGGPHLVAASQLARQPGGTPPQKTLSDAIDVLREIESLAHNEERLKLERPD
jgi:hypothetical protein